MNAGIRRELTKPPPPCRAARSGMDADTAIHPCLLGKGEPQREASGGRRARAGGPGRGDCRGEAPSGCWDVAGAGVTREG